MNITAALELLNSWKLGKEHLHGVQMTHYVKDPKVAHLMLEHGQIRLTKIDEMKGDLEEGKYVLTLYEKALNELKGEGKISDKEYGLLINSNFDLDSYLILRKVGARYEPLRIHLTPYVICFCSNDSDQKMRNRYGSDDSIAIKYCINEYYQSLIVNLPPPEKSSFILVYRVCYDECKVVGAIKEYVSKAIKLDDVDECIHLVRHMLNKCHLFVKKESLKDENETRLIFLKPENIEDYPDALACICDSYMSLDADGAEVMCKYDSSNDKFVWMDAKKIINSAVLGTCCSYTKEEIERMMRKENPNFIVYPHDYRSKWTE